MEAMTPLATLPLQAASCPSWLTRLWPVQGGVLLERQSQVGVSVASASGLTATTVWTVSTALELMIPPATLVMATEKFPLWAACTFDRVRVGVVEPATEPPSLR